jgi:GTPase
MTSNEKSENAKSSKSKKSAETSSPVSATPLGKSVADVAPMQVEPNENFRCGTIAIVGRPNVGKSTLLNHLVGQKVTITSKKAQTTRHRITGIFTDADAQFLFLDTPGFQKTHENALNRVLNRTVTQAVADADVIVFAIEAGKFLPADELVLNALNTSDAAANGTPIILVVNKIDRVEDKQKLLTFLNDITSRLTFAAVVPTSVKNKATLEELKRAIKSRLPVAPAVFAVDEITDKSERFMAAEFIREKVFRQVGEELPYSISVLIEKFEQEGNLRRIFATIVVDKSSQKAIIIGTKGERLKRIGTDARKDMEVTFAAKVYLELFVRVKKGWADNEAMLRQYGYE